MEGIQVAITIGCALLGALVGYLGLQRLHSKDCEDDGKQSGVMLTELGYIKSGVDDIKAEQREQRKINTEFYSRLAAVEGSAKQAHHRIDRLECREDNRDDLK